MSQMGQQRSLHHRQKSETSQPWRSGHSVHVVPLGQFTNSTSSIFNVLSQNASSGP
jgi:hypothetical protein